MGTNYIPTSPDQLQQHFSVAPTNVAYKEKNLSRLHGAVHPQDAIGCAARGDRVPLEPLKMFGLLPHELTVS